ncbi:hypothetical protein B7755_046320 [Streptomyces sp. NBS 14/10]|uniref:hypothetical protein n=1 Tax=Streptomyces sp. NBS 14/10 TaxID=1945643 RepID=UPI00211ADC98|nr:hypothetical protein [Streptomyces sp. NBS 14/10]KAK1186467.1 hypothetical protein B7755_046320 [Streptomyces sp. NBS 14/10]
MVRPVLLVDVDGPLNPYAARPHRRPEGYETHRLLTPRWHAAERRRLNEWGLPDKPVKPLRVWLNPDHGPALASLPYDLVWATTWEEEANDFLAPLLGLPTLPFVPWPEPRPEPENGVFWKTPSIVTWARGRPFAWVDDEITDADRVWTREHHAGQALLHHVDPRTGLTAADFALLSDWAQGLARTSPATDR